MSQYHDGGRWVAPIDINRDVIILVKVDARSIV